MPLEFKNEDLEYAISTADEPFYRQFFTEVAQACGRPVMP